VGFVIDRDDSGKQMSLKDDNSKKINLTSETGNPNFLSFDEIRKSGLR
jgi:hypothetical protein